MARTNKMGILKKKQQQAKQKQLMVGTDLEQEVIKKNYENPKGNSFVRFQKTGKYYCDSTSVREDPDGYRIVRKPNSGEIFFEFKGEQSYGYRRWIKKIRKHK